MAVASGRAGADPGLRLVFLGTSHPVALRRADPPPVPSWRSERSPIGPRRIRRAPGGPPPGCRTRSGPAGSPRPTSRCSPHRPGLETEFAFRTRVLDHLWAGLPTVGTAGDVLVDRLAAAGRRRSRCRPATRPGSRTRWASRWRARPAARAEAAARSSQLADDYRWDRVAEPLIEFCRAPRRAPDLVLPAAERALLGIPAASPMPVWTRLAAARREGGLGLVARRAARRLRPTPGPGSRSAS